MRFELLRVNYRKRIKEIQGKSILVRVSEGSSYRESTVLQKNINIQRIPGEKPWRILKDLFKDLHKDLLRMLQGS